MRLVPLAGALAISLASLTACEKKVDTNLAVDQANNPVAVYQNGVLLLQNPPKDGLADYGTAYARFAAAAELFDGSGEKAKALKAHYNAGWTAEKQGQLADAEKHYRIAADADASYEKALYSLARVLVAENRAGEAVGIYKAIADAKPTDASAANDLMQAYADAGQYADAIAQAQQVLLKDPKSAATYRTLSAMYYVQGNYGMSQLCAEKALTLNDGDSGTHNNLGVTLLLQKDESGAIQKFQTARKLDSKNFEANMNLGFVALNSGDYNLAIDCFTAATTANPSSIDAMLGLAVGLRGKKEFSQADNLYDQIIHADPKNELAYFNAATLHQRYTKNFNKALDYLQAYIDGHAGQIGPQHPVFQRVEEVKVAQAAEQTRIEALRKAEQEKKEREERALLTLKELDGLVADITGKLGSCPASVQEEVTTWIETAKQVVADQDTSMVTDVKSMYTDYYSPMVSECVPTPPPVAPAESAPVAPPAETPPAATPDVTPAQEETAAPVPTPPG